MDAFEGDKVAGSHHCEAAVSHLKGQGNQMRLLMTGKNPNVMLIFKKAKEEDIRDLQDVQPNLSPKENMEQILLESISSTSKKRR